MEALELIPICKGEDVSLMAVERQAYAVAIEAAKLDQLAAVCRRRIAETNGDDRAAYDVAQAISRGGARARRGCSND